MNATQNDAHCRQGAPSVATAAKRAGTRDAKRTPGTRGGLRRREHWTGFSLCLPAWVLLCALYLAPIIVLALLSVTDYEMGAVRWKVVGLDNYRRAFSDPVFRRSLANTLLYMVLVVPLSVAGGLFIALLVHARGVSRAFYEVIYFLPVTATLVAMATVWQFLLHPTLGPFNHLLDLAGLGRHNFLNQPGLMLPTLAAIGIWQLLGFNMILFLSRLSQIPQSLYDAAAIDGASHAIDRFLCVTVPLLGPTLLFVIVTSSITAFKIFDTVAVLTQGRHGSEVLLYDIYLEGFTYSRTGYAAALTVIFLALILLLSVWQTRQLDKKVHYA